MHSIAVSILNYRGASATLACLQSLLAQQPTPGRPFRLEVFVFDNGSGEAEQRRLRDELPRTPNVHLTRSPKNVGFSAGHNRNIRTIVDTVRPDYIWLLNNDCIVQPECVNHLLECALDSPDTALWGATILEPDGKTVQCGGGCRYNAWVTSYQQNGKGKPIERIDEIDGSQMDYVAGASLFLPTRQIEAAFEPPAAHDREIERPELEFLNETFFLYFEELDLARRLKRGYRMAWCQEAHIVHFGGLATQARKGMRSANAEYHSTLSALKFTQIHHPGRLWIVAPIRFVAKCAQLGFTGNARLLGETWRAYRDFFSGR